MSLTSVRRGRDDEQRLTAEIERARQYSYDQSRAAADQKRVERCSRPFVAAA